MIKVGLCLTQSGWIKCNVSQL